MPRELPEYTYLPDDLLTPEQAAALFRVSATRIRIWARNGRIPEARTAKGRRYRYGDLLEILRDQP